MSKINCKDCEKRDTCPGGNGDLDFLNEVAIKIKEFKEMSKMYVGGILLEDLLDREEVRRVNSMVKEELDAKLKDLAKTIGDHYEQ